MSLMESIRLAFEGIRTNKMRSFLTMLGIIIGIAAVIGILTVGQGLSGSITGAMSDVGASTVSVSLQQRDTEQMMRQMQAGVMNFGTPEEEDLISPEMLEGLRQQYPDKIKAIALSENLGAGQARDGALYANLSLTGVNEEYFTVSEVDMLAGRRINEDDETGSRMICMVSDKLVNNLFEGDLDAALGGEVTVEAGTNTWRFRIVGVYEYEASAFGLSMASDKDVTTGLYLPLSTAKELTGAPEGYSSFNVLSQPEANSAETAQAVQDYLNRYYRRNEDYSVMAISMESVIEIVDDMMDTLSIAISVIAAISLLVGGIGVMNIMLVSVTERTREIGTRKALGATNRDIQVQFVVESAVICLVGGIFGIILGAVMGYVGSYLLDAPALPGLGSIALAVGFSLAVGIFFGYYPANKAAKMDPIEALRYE